LFQWHRVLALIDQRRLFQNQCRLYSLRYSSAEVFHLSLPTDKRRFGIRVILLLLKTAVPETMLKVYFPHPTPLLSNNRWYEVAKLALDRIHWKIHPTVLFPNPRYYPCHFPSYPADP